MKGLKFRLIVMNFLELAVLGSYIISLGSFLARHGHPQDIGTFYAAGGFISLFTPLLMGLVADRRISSQKLLGMLHLLLGCILISFGLYAKDNIASGNILISLLFYCLIPLTYLPTLPLTISTSFAVLSRNSMDIGRSYPPIRMFGTIGFIIGMVLVDFLGFQYTHGQFFVAACFAFLQALWSMLIPNCPPGQDHTRTSLLSSFKLLKSRSLLVFFAFILCMGIMLKISEAYTNPCLSDAGVVHANALISLSRISEALFILLIPFFLKKIGIRRILMGSILAWCVYYAALGSGDAEGRLYLYIVSMAVYGMAFNFFNIAGSIYLEQNTDDSVRSTAQGMMSLLTNGAGSLIGAVTAQGLVNKLVYRTSNPDWSSVWFILSGLCIILFCVFAVIFKPEKKEMDCERIKGGE